MNFENAKWGNGVGVSRDTAPTDPRAAKILRMREKTLFPTSNGDAVIIEYHRHGKRWLPHSIVTTEATWDADWSQRHEQLLVHNSGSGHWIGRNDPHDVSGYSRVSPPVCRIWAASFVTFSRYVSRGKSASVSDAGLLKLGYQRIAEPLGDPFDDARECNRTVYCSICDDRMDDDDHCGHVFSAEHDDDGPGSENGPYGSTKESFLRMVRATGIARGLRRGLVPFKLGDSQMHALGGLGPSFVHVYSRGKDLGDIARRLDGRQYLNTDGLRDGISWLFSLDKKTKAANATTKQWLDGEVQKQDARRVSGAAVYVVRGDYWYGSYVTDEAHADFKADGSQDQSGGGRRGSGAEHGVWWTHYSGRDFATRMTWPEALALREKIRRLNLAEHPAIVCCPLPVKMVTS